MFLTDSYLRMLKKVDSSWQEKASPKTSRTSLWRKSKPRRLFKRARNKRNSSCSSESGHYSEDGSNLSSGYYGDDEVDRCTCGQMTCTVKAQDLSDYDIISVNFSNTKNSVPELPVSMNSSLAARKPFVLNVDEYIIIPSTREEFCAGKFRTNVQEQHRIDMTYSSNANVELNEIVERRTNNCISRQGQSAAKRYEVKQSITIAISNSISVTKVQNSASSGASEIKEKTKMCRSCSDDTYQIPRTFPVCKFPSLKSKTFNGVNWWRDNILWQLQQRNNTQTENFAQLDTSRNCSRPKIKINKDVVHYINKFTDLQRLSTTNPFFVDTSAKSLTKSDLIEAIRAQSKRENEVRIRSGSIADRANAFLKKGSDLAKELGESEDTEDGRTSSVQAYRSTTKCRRRTYSHTRPQTRMYPWWRKSVHDQLKMRNLLECKYFVDAVARGQMSQSTESRERPHMTSCRFIDEYDIISDDDLTCVEKHLSDMNMSQSVSQGYHSLPPNCRESAFSNPLNNARAFSFPVY